MSSCDERDAEQMWEARRSMAEEQFGHVVSDQPVTTADSDDNRSSSLRCESFLVFNGVNYQRNEERERERKKNSEGESHSITKDTTHLFEVLLFVLRFLLHGFEEQSHETKILLLVQRR
jgi:hypothetical protein